MKAPFFWRQLRQIASASCVAVNACWPLSDSRWIICRSAESVIPSALLRKTN
jgi:hypothetical protein